MDARAPRSATRSARLLQGAADRGRRRRACGRRSRGAISKARADAIIETLRAAGANLGVHVRAARRSRTARRAAGRRAASSTSSAADASASASAPCCATTRARIAAPAHGSAASATHPLMIDARLEGLLSHARRQPTLKRWRPATACASPSSFARRFIAGETSRKRSPPRARSKRTGLTQTLDYLGESVASHRRGRRGDARLPRDHRRDRRGRHRPQHLAEADAARARRRSRDLRRQPAADSRRRRRAHEFFVRIDMENSPYTAGHARHLRDDVAAGLPQRRRRAAVVPAAQRRAMPRA